MNVIKLFLLMTAVGTVTFGGGYAIIPVLQYNIVEKMRWLSTSEFATGIMVGQISPGPLSMMVSYLGYKIAGVPGAVAGTVGLLLPAFLAVVFLANIYQRYKDRPAVKAGLRGISLAVIGLLFATIVDLGKASVLDWKAFLIALGSLLVTGPLRKSPLWVIAGAGLVGSLIYH